MAFVTDQMEPSSTLSVPAPFSVDQNGGKNTEKGKMIDSEKFGPDEMFKASALLRNGSIDKSRASNSEKNGGVSLTNDLEKGDAAPQDITNDVPPPENEVEILQQWNSPRINLWRVLATFFSFFVFGMNDGANGALLPYIEKYYKLSYTVVSLVFLTPFSGYTVASTVNNKMHVYLGQRGIAIVAPLCHLISYIILAVHPPFPVLVVMFVFVGFGNGLIDGAWCAWLGNMQSANQVSGFLQASYALGATVSPLIATAMVTKAGLMWYQFYYIMIGAYVLELASSTWAFWEQTGPVYQKENPRDPASTKGRTREAIGNKITWIFALFVFCYVGCEVSLGGWITTFMLRARHASPLAAGLSSTGFWAGMTLGRSTLSFLTSHLGEFPSVLVYLSVSLTLELLFWLVPSSVSSSIFVAFLGFTLGPIFPTAIVLVTKLMPRELHVGSIAFATAFGGSGGAIFPFVVGVIAERRGVWSLQPVIVALIVVMGGLWGLLRGKEREKGISREDSVTSVEGEVR